MSILPPPSPLWRASIDDLRGRLTLDRKPARVPPVRARRQHLLALRGQRPFGALFHHQPQRHEFVADRVGGELGAAVRQAFERRALRLAEDDEFLFFGHLGCL